MARIDKSVVGKVSGKLGDIVFRNLNGKELASLRPSNYKASQSAEAKRGRNNFGVTVNFAKRINSVPQLKQIWQDADLPGTLTFNRIIKYNSKRVKDGSLTAFNKITPDGLFLTANEVSVQDNNLNLIFNFPAATNMEFPLTLFIFFFFDKQYIFSRSRAIELRPPGDLYDLNINIDSEITRSFEINPNPFVYFALSGIPVNKKKIYWSSTSAKQL